MVKNYRKKPVVIEAVQFDGEDIHQIMNFIEKLTGMHNSEVLEYDPEGNVYSVKTPEGNMMLREGDYLIRGVKGEFYPCKPDIFEQTYEEVQDAN